MRLVLPFYTVKDALTELDNGGHFFNIFTDASDGEIEQAELAKVAGLFSDQQKMFLYLDMVLSELTEEDADTVIGSLSEKLQQQYLLKKPQHLASTVEAQPDKLGSSIIISGTPKLVESKADFNGFIMVPITLNNVTTFSLIPIFDQYDVYQISDKSTEKTFVIAHTQSHQKLEEVPTTFGGTLKELQRKSEQSQTIFLEIVYYSI
ncbi:hypothetical protein JQC92_17755 [Shewanella sp. 202IG2-18]|uniref:hypothetical protein n=1 Tax=Parashewanella hymeniacidonis TaxID=2807618 RepID=UPI001961CF0D|nr:hypothetical protein [Parashewanella hymeniacidonis]MBM7073856.1 hypothetical protein [Parashewanella hymeniacidonis]